jgi:hypothetical protein
MAELEPAKGDLPNRRARQGLKTGEFRHQESGGSNMQEPSEYKSRTLVAGFLLGLLLPSTTMEDEKLGEAADAVKVKAAETGEEALDRGKRVAQEVAESAAQTAKESGGQHAGELAGSARGRAAEAAETARSSTEPQSGVGRKS